MYVHQLHSFQIIPRSLSHPPLFSFLSSLPLPSPLPSPSTVDEKTEFDFQALRLDWFRLQALASNGRAELRWVTQYTHLHTRLHDIHVKYFFLWYTVCAFSASFTLFHLSLSSFSLFALFTSLPFFFSFHSLSPSLPPSLPPSLLLSLPPFFSLSLPLFLPLSLPPSPSSYLPLSSFPLFLPFLLPLSIFLLTTPHPPHFCLPSFLLILLFVSLHSLFFHTILPPPSPPPLPSSLPPFLPSSLPPFPSSPPPVSLSLKEQENKDLAPTMNAVVVHSRLVDSFEEVLIQQADLSFMW